MADLRNAENRNHGLFLRDDQHSADKSQKYLLFDLALWARGLQEEMSGEMKGPEEGEAVFADLVEFSSLLFKIQWMLSSSFWPPAA